MDASGSKSPNTSSYTAQFIETPSISFNQPTTGYSDKPQIRVSGSSVYIGGQPTPTDTGTAVSERKIRQLNPSRPSHPTPQEHIQTIEQLEQTQQKLMTDSWLSLSLLKTQTGLSAALRTHPLAAKPKPCTPTLNPSAMTGSLNPIMSNPTGLPPVFQQTPTLPAAPKKVPDNLKTYLAAKETGSSLLSATLPVGVVATTAAQPTTKKITSYKRKPTTHQKFQEKFQSKLGNDLTKLAAQLTKLASNEITAESLWSMASDSAANARNQFLEQRKLTLPYQQENELTNIFAKAREYFLNAQKKGLDPIYKSSNDTINPDPDPEHPPREKKIRTETSARVQSPSTMATKSTDADYSTASLISSQNEPATSASKAAAPGPVAALKDPGNRCFVNSVIHYLRATMNSAEQQALMEFIPGDSGIPTEDFDIIVPLSKLFIAMREYENSPSVVTVTQINAALNNLLVSYSTHPVLSKVITPNTSRTRSHPRFSGITLEQIATVKLEQNDANDFLMPLQNALQQLISGFSPLEMQQVLQTEHNGVTFTKKTKAVTAPALVIPLQKSGAIQQSIDHFFAPEPSEYDDPPVNWDEQFAITFLSQKIHLPAGKYPTSKTCQITANLAQLSTFNIRLGLETSLYKPSESGEKQQEAYVNLISHTFNPVVIPVLNTDTKLIASVRGSPKCIIARTGSDLQEGHYICLEKKSGGWLVHNQGESFTVNDPEAYLRNKVFYPYIISYTKDN